VKQLVEIRREHRLDRGEHERRVRRDEYLWRRRLVATEHVDRRDDARDNRSLPSRMEVGLGLVEQDHESIFRPAIPRASAPCRAPEEPEETDGAAQALGRPR
jgi:hypothetical protein